MRDRFIENEVKEFYEIFDATGSSFKVHESRMIRYSNNEDEISSIEVAFNALEVDDNILWSAGQAMYRYGLGFPVITIRDPEQMTVNGENISEVEWIKRKGILNYLWKRLRIKLNDGNFLLNYL